MYSHVSLVKSPQKLLVHAGNPSSSMTLVSVYFSSSYEVSVRNCVVTSHLKKSHDSCIASWAAVCFMLMPPLVQLLLHSCNCSSKWKQIATQHIACEQTALPRSGNTQKLPCWLHIRLCHVRLCTVSQIYALLE